MKTLQRLLFILTMSLAFTSNGYSSNKDKEFTEEESREISIIAREIDKQLGDLIIERLSKRPDLQRKLGIESLFSTEAIKFFCR